jgi:VWFA-related protein
MKLVRALQLSLVLLLAAAPLQAQQTPNISVKVKVVNVLATVRDKHGNIIRNLTKDDFTLEEDGHPQTIKYYLQEDNLPLTLGLLVDTSGSQRNVLSDERSASHTFLDHVVREDMDKAFLIHFDREVELLQDLTSSRQKLESSLDLLEAPQRNGNGSPGYGSGGQGRGGGTLLYDAIWLASGDVMEKQQGRKALIVLTDGVDRGSKESLQSAIAAAQRADTLIYSILFKGEEGHRGGGGGFGGMHGGMGPMGGGGRRQYPRQEERPDGKKVLQQISEETGGRLFEVSGKQPIDKIYAQIEEELRNQYSLGYTPEGSDAEIGYHRIHLAAKKKDLIVQARDGFYADR